MEGVGLPSVSEVLCQPSTDLILQTDQLAVVSPDVNHTQAVKNFKRKLLKLS
jgi:hypothetical protein